MLIHSLENRRFKDFKKYFKIFLYSRDLSPKSATFIVYTFPYYELTFTAELKEIDNNDQLFLIYDVEYKCHGRNLEIFMSKSDVAVYNYTENVILHDANLYKGFRMIPFSYILSSIFIQYPFLFF